MLKIAKEIPFVANSPPLPIKLLGTDKAASPFAGGEFGMIGFAPKGAFIEYLKKAYVWRSKDKQTVGMFLSAKKSGSQAQGFSNGESIFKGTLAFNSDRAKFPIDTQMSHY